MGVRADLFVRLAHEAFQFGLGDASVHDLHLHGEAEAAAVTRTDGDRAGDLRLGGVALLLLADEIKRAAEARGVARGEEMLRRRLARYARPAELLGTERFALTMPSLVSVCPLRPPTAVAVAV